MFVLCLIAEHLPAGSLHIHLQLKPTTHIDKQFENFYTIVFILSFTIHFINTDNDHILSLISKMIIE